MIGPDGMHAGHAAGINTQALPYAGPAMWISACLTVYAPKCVGCGTAALGRMLGVHFIGFAKH
jgi:hypothetical protein